MTLLIILYAILVSYWLFLTILYLVSIDKQNTKMKFKQFRELYEKDPKVFWFDKYDKMVVNSGIERISIRFGYIDSIIFYFFRKTVERRLENQENEKNIEKIEKYINGK